MGGVSWVKLSVDMFDNRKIRFIRRLPDGNSIVLIWVMLLTLAGRCNSGGMIFLTENIPYTPKMLADELDFEESTVILALQSLEQLGMVQTSDDGFLAISGWEEHQNIDGLEKIREQNRLRKQRQRQRLLTENSQECDGHVTVTQCHATEKEIEKIKTEIKNDIGVDKPPARSRFVPPTVEEVLEYCNERGNGVDAERFVDFYTANGWKQGAGKPIKDWRAAVRTWERREPKSGRNEGTNRAGRPDQEIVFPGITVF